ncbi:hypothetical protein CCACVL1_21678 [Corchorus capsularis]|uniref:Uncharacterized protein n=1 Tax=Corchorus capsularis TaxID=210143 RepID=A0A1R3H2H3_COCAP|nr:hypothetical protein CCACVL1_21678 [Corchorus capsularis]
MEKSIQKARVDVASTNKPQKGRLAISSATSAKL